MIFALKLASVAETARREIVLDIVSECGCRNDSGGIYKLTGFTLGYSTISLFLTQQKHSRNPSSL